MRKLVHYPLGQIQQHRIMLQNQPTQKARTMEVMNTKKNKKHKKKANLENRIDPNQSSKRRVRRGSDPIHNRC